MALTALYLSRWMRIGIVIFILGIFQAGILPAFWPFMIRPDIFLVLIVVMALQSSSAWIAVYALLCGLFKDALGLRFFGFNSLVFSIEAFLIYYGCRHLYREAAWLKFILLISATLLNYSLLTIALKRPYILTGLLEAGLNCLFLPWVHKLYTSCHAHT